MKLMQCMYKYSLHKKSIKHTCPCCDKKRFVLYIDTESNEYVSLKVGRCDREISCGYHYTPKMFFESRNLVYNSLANKKVSALPSENQKDYHSIEDIDQTLVNFDKNKFISFLKSKFDIEKVNQTISDYKIGTACNNYFGTVFWQIDNEGKVRGGKVLNYDKFGKRNKYINWIHSTQIKNKKIKKFNLVQCLFGLHLMDRSTKAIAIVESEKTACIMSVLFEKYEWMATGSLNGLNKNKLKPIKKRAIILYPDLGIDNGNGTPFSQWYQKKEVLNKLGFKIEISDLLEQKATDFDRSKGLDIADYFIDNPKQKTRKIKSNQDSVLMKLYMKNKNIKTLIEAFDLTNLEGNNFSF